MATIKVTLSKIRLQNISNAPTYIPSENEVVINRADNNLYYGKSGVKTVIGQDAIVAHLADLSNPHAVTLDIARTLNNQITGPIDFNTTEVLNPSAIKFDINTEPILTPEGAIWWNNKEYTINVATGMGATLQLGEELVMLYYNDTGSIIPNGTVLHPKSGVLISGTYLPTPDLADATKHELLQGTLTVSTHDIGIGAIGFATRFGKVREIDTSIFGAGDQLWVSTTPGEMTNIKPSFPDYAVSMGGTLNSEDAPTGELFVSITGAVHDTFHDAWDGAIRESFDFRVTSDGVNIVGTLSNITNNRNLTLLYSDGLFTLDTTTIPLTILLTPATLDTAPIFNYVYIPISTKVLTVSTSEWPAEEHCKVATLVLQTATGVQTNGALRNQNWNDHIKKETDNGHILHIAERIRQLNAEHEDGCETTLTGTTSNVYINTTSGRAYQMHLQTFPAISMETGDDIHIINDPVTAYRTTNNLNTVTTYSDGSNWNNQWTNIVIIGICNKSGEASHIMCNLSSNGYTSEADAIADRNNYTNYTIPRLFKGVGILLARFTIRRSSTNYTYNSGTGYLDLRGYYPNNTVGGGAGSSGITTYLGLTDTPATLVASAFQRVNVGGTVLENILANAISLSEFNNDLSLTDFTNDLTTALVPENTNLYYTEARVSANTNVAANTAKITNATHTGDVTGATALTIADSKINDNHLTTKFKGTSALTGTAVDWDLELTRTKTLTANTTLTFSNLYNGVKFLETTGDYSITFPTGFTYVGGERAATGTTLYQIVCTNSSTPVGYYAILKDES